MRFGAGISRGSIQLEALLTTSHAPSPGPAASNCTPPRSPAGGSGARPSASSTGWPRRGSRGGRCCRSGRRTGTARRTSPRRRSRRGRGCWPTRGRRCRGRTSSTSASATRTGSTTGRRRGSVADQVRFDREWAALRVVCGGARRAADRRRADLRRARARSTTARIRSCSATTRWRARRRTPTPTRASCGATRCTTGRRCSGAAIAGGPSGFRRTFELYDLARIDHFRGFVAYWAVPRGARHALGGALAARAGPGAVRRRVARARASCR